jgi:hypothetical protein
VWADGVVVAAPPLNEDPGLGEGVEYLRAQQLVAELAIEALHVPVIPQAAWLEERMEEARRRHAIVPLESNALALRLSTLRPGPDLAAALAKAREGNPQGELLEPPSVAEQRLRQQVGELVAAQAVEDAGGSVLAAAPVAVASRGAGLYHAYNAVLKRVHGVGRGPR